MSAANRRRAADAERAVVRYLRAQGWPDTRRYLAGDGRQPGDIDWHPLICCEVKDRAASSWPAWCRQAAEEAPSGTVPVVVRRVRGVPDVGLWPCRWALTGVIPTPGPGTGGRGAGAPDGGHLWWADAFHVFVDRVRDLDGLALPEGLS